MNGVQRIKKSLDSAWTLSKKFGHTMIRGVNGMPKKLDLTGYTFHGCTVLRTAIGKRKSTAWYCECVCGKEFILTTASLRSGRPQSCGCKGNIIRPKLK